MPIEAAAQLFDVPLPVEVELARCVLPVQHLLTLRVGSVVPLKKAAGGKVDIMVGDVRIGTGDVVVVQGTIGVRVTSTEQPGDGLQEVEGPPPASQIERSTAALGAVDILEELWVPVRVSLGAVNVPFRRILELAPGGVIALNTPPHAPVTIFAANRVFAEGLVVVVEGNYGVEIKRLGQLNPGFAASRGADTFDDKRGDAGSLPELSKEESGPVAIDPYEPSSAVEVFDFRRGECLSNLELGSIRLMHDAFVRALAVDLSAHLCSPVSGKILNVTQLLCSEFLEAQASPRYLALLNIAPQGSIAVLAIGQQLLFAFLELLLGGTGEDGSDISRDMTPIEQQLLAGVYQALTHNLSVAWQSLDNVEFKLGSVQTDPRLPGVLAEDDSVVVVGIELKAGRQVGAINLAVPSAFVKTLIENTGGQRRSSTSQPSEMDPERADSLCRKLEVLLELQLNEQTILLKDLLELRPGDVIDLGVPVETPLSCSVGGIPKFRGYILGTEPRKVFQVEEVHQTLPSDLPSGLPN